MHKLFILLWLFPIVFFSCVGTNEPGEKDSSTQKGTIPPPPPTEEDIYSSTIQYVKHDLVNLEDANSLVTVLCQPWDLREDYDEAYLTRGANYLDAVYRGYRFFEDNQLVKNFRSEYVRGNWSIDQRASSKIIQMKFENGEEESFILASLAPYSLKLSRTADVEKNLIEYVGRAVVNNNPAQDAFSIQNNAWRKKPSQPESKAEIRRRLKECIHFFVLYYDFQIESKAETVNFVGLPTCFRWYAGGIYLLKQSELPENWIQCFYNKAQAMEAYEMASRLLDFSYQWPESETNWVKQNAAVLKQMENKIDEIEL